MRRGRLMRARDTPRPGADEGSWTPSTELDARPRVLAQQQVAVEVDVVAERRDAAARRDPEPGLEHAAEHHAHAQRAGGVDDANRLADAARLRELDVDAMRDLGAPRDVGERMTVLVDVDRDRRARLQLAPSVVARLQRLLAVLHAELRELRDRVERFLERPPLVDVDHQRQIRSRSHGSDALDVEAVSASELELESPKRRRRPSLRDAPCRRDPRARPSTRSVGRLGAGRAACARRCRAAFPGGRGAPRRAQPSPPARPRSTRGARRCPRARTGRRRRPCRGRPRTAAPTRPTRRSGRPAPPRRSP